ncbi:hypothetical protein [Streptomyces blastmyceticus]|uniref:Uncharacterized protein n=1 Tax=Streptomyces blastmyceticus TaxID=68180 RepID=A0ABP3HUN6_9ACTN
MRTVPAGRIGKCTTVRGKAPYRTAQEVHSERLPSPPSSKRGNRIEKLFTTKVLRRVQPPAETHEYKKESGSSDGAMTYDTTKV